MGSYEGGPSAVAPSGPAGGDLGGTYPAPSVGAVGGQAAAAVAAHVVAVGNPHATTAADVGADPAGAAASAVGTHEGSFPHGNLPTSDQKSALAGTDGVPGGGNRYVTNSDARMSDARAPTGTAGGSLGGTYPNPTMAWTTDMDEDFTVGLTFVSGGNVYNGRTWTYDNAANATSVIANDGGVSGLHITCNAINSNLYDGTRTAPGIRIPLSALIPNVSFVRERVAIICEVSGSPDQTYEAVGVCFELDQQTANRYHLKGVRICESAPNAAREVEVTVNAVGGCPQVYATSADLVFMILVEAGGYGVFSRAAYSADPDDANWTLLASNVMDKPASYTRRWHNGWIFLHAQTGNTAGNWSPYVKRCTVRHR